jgi:hypothetical protein
MDITSDLRFDPAGQSTLLRWASDLRPHGLVRLLTPVIAAAGRRQTADIWSYLQTTLQHPAGSHRTQATARSIHRSDVSMVTITPVVLPGARRVRTLDAARRSALPLSATPADGRWSVVRLGEGGERLLVRWSDKARPGTAPWRRQMAPPSRSRRAPSQLPLGRGRLRVQVSPPRARTPWPQSSLASPPRLSRRLAQLSGRGFGARRARPCCGVVGDVTQIRADLGLCPLPRGSDVSDAVNLRPSRRRKHP